MALVPICAGSRLLSDPVSLPISHNLELTNPPGNIQLNQLRHGLHVWLPNPTPSHMALNASHNADQLIISRNHRSLSRQFWNWRSFNLLLSKFPYRQIVREYWISKRSLQIQVQVQIIRIRMVLLDSCDISSMVAQGKIKLKKVNNTCYEIQQEKRSFSGLKWSLPRKRRKSHEPNDKDQIYLPS